MRNRLVQLIPIILALFAIGFADFSQQCTQIGGICYGTFIDHIIPTITYPAYFFAFYFLPAAILLIFVPRSVFKSWLKFAVWALPLAFLDIATTAVNPSVGHLGVLTSGPNRDQVAHTDGAYIFIASAVVVAFAFIRKSLLASGKHTEQQVKHIMRELWALAAAITGAVFSMLLQTTPSGWATLSTQLNNFGGAVFFGLIGLGYALYLAFKSKRAKQRISWRLWSAFACTVVTLLIMG